MQIEQRHDHLRACGVRKPGGLYLVCDAPSASCGKFPVPLERCPTCDQGIKPSRSWTWVNADGLLRDQTCNEDRLCAYCPMSKPVGRAGLIWIGEQFYGTPESWLREAGEQGISRRVTGVPRGFVVGETWVLVGHRRVRFEAGVSPGIFSAFRPTAIEYIVKGDETEEKLIELVKRGVTPVKVRHV